MLAGGGLGNAVLFSIGQAFRRADSRVLYFRRLQEAIDRPLQGRRHRSRRRRTSSGAATRRLGFTATRPQDRAFVGNIVEAMHAYASGVAGGDSADSVRRECDRVMAIGSDRMMAAVGAARHTVSRAVSQARASRACVDQLADAVHDEGDLRAMPATAPRPGVRQAVVCIFLLQSGPAHRPRRLSRTVRAARAEFGAGKVDGAVGRALPRRRSGLNFRDLRFRCPGPSLSVVLRHRTPRHGPPPPLSGNRALCVFTR